MTRKIAALLAFVVLVGFGLADLNLFAAPPDLREGFSHVADKAIPAVVFVKVEKRLQGIRQSPFGPGEFFGDEFLQRFFGQPAEPGQRGQRSRQSRPFVQTGQGSGFIVSKDGYILTNNHVIDGADKITVRLNSGKEYVAKLIGTDEATEVAVIKIEETELPTVELGDISSLKIGQWVVAIGNPFGLSETLTVGVVSALGRKNMGISNYEDFIQTDAAINPGNSGGPLLDIEGRVVGINTAIFSRSGGYMGIGFAVPIDMAVAVKEQLIKDGKVTRGYLGIMMNPGEIDDDVASSLGLGAAGGVLIADLVPDGPAEKAGLESGDVILKLNGHSVNDSARFRTAIARMKPGSEVQLTIFRKGRERVIKAKLGTMPGEDAQENGAPKQEGAIDLGDTLGIKVTQANGNELEQLGFEKTKNGVVVSEVIAGSPADQAGLQEGLLIEAINQHKVEKLADLQEGMRDAKGEKVVRLRLRSKVGTRYAFIRPEWE